MSNAIERERWMLMMSSQRRVRCSVLHSVGEERRSTCWRSQALMIRSRPMSDPLLHTITLVAHPEARNDAVRSIGARVSRLRSGALTIAYTLDADLDRLRIPPPRPPR